MSIRSVGYQKQQMFSSRWLGFSLMLAVCQGTMTTEIAYAQTTKAAAAAKPAEQATGQDGEQNPALLSADPPEGTDGEDQVESSSNVPDDTLRMIRRYGSIGPKNQQEPVQFLAAVSTLQNQQKAEKNLELAFAEMQRLYQLFDAQDINSSIYQLNNQAGGAPVRVPTEVYDVLREALRIAQLSKGAYSPTTGALEDTWHLADALRNAADDADDEGDTKKVRANLWKPPSKADVQAALALSTAGELVLDPVEKTAVLRTAGSKLSISTLAKAYALEKTAAWLQTQGTASFVISVGGSVIVRGKRGETPWMVGVRDPRGEGHFAALPSGNGAWMTRGDYEMYTFVDKKRYSNLLDPRTGYPTKNCRSATVFHENAVTAMVLATAFCNMGGSDSLALLKKIDKNDKAGTVLVGADNKVFVSKGLKKNIKQQPPTDAP